MRISPAIVSLAVVACFARDASAEVRRPSHFLTEGPSAPLFFDTLDPHALAAGIAEHMGTLARATIRRTEAFSGLASEAAEACGARLEGGLTSAARYEASAEPFATRQGQLLLPLDAALAGGEEAPFGDRRRTSSYTTMRHSGVSFAVEAPTDVRAIARGVVVHVGIIDGLGRVVIVDHGDGYHSVSAQLSEARVALWQAVDVGEVLGEGGVTSTFGVQEIYFELRHEGVPLDPAAWFAPLTP